jgi:hypothetical protein
MAQGAKDFIVGAKPMWGLPTEPWEDAMVITFSPVVPQAPLRGQYERTQVTREVFVRVLKTGTLSVTVCVTMPPFASVDTTTSLVTFL